MTSTMLYNSVFQRVGRDLLRGREASARGRELSKKSMKFKKIDLLRKC